MNRNAKKTWLGNSQTSEGIAFLISIREERLYRVGLQTWITFKFQGHDPDMPSGLRWLPIRKEVYCVSDLRKLEKLLYSQYHIPTKHLLLTSDRPDILPL